MKRLPETEAAKRKFKELTCLRVLGFHACPGSMRGFWGVRVAITDEVRAFWKQFHKPGGKKTFGRVHVEFFSGFYDEGIDPYATWHINRSALDALPLP